MAKDRNRALRAKTFRAWFKANLAEQSEDIARHGADAGWPHITYTSDCVRLFDRYGSEIWDMATDMAEQSGAKNACDMIAAFNRSDMIGTLNQFKNLMVWFACEEVAREMHPEL